MIEVGLGAAVGAAAQRFAAGALDNEAVLALDHSRTRFRKRFGHRGEPVGFLDPQLLKPARQILHCHQGNKLEGARCRFGEHPRCLRTVPRGCDDGLRRERGRRPQDGAHIVRVGDLIEDVDASEASEVVDRQLMADQLRNALSDLEPREATIMSLRFGLMDGRPRTLDEIGKHLGLTRERIRQLEKQSLAKLRHPSRAQQLLDFAS